jgi:hypothetical protein
MRESTEAMMLQMGAAQLQMGAMAYKQMVKNGFSMASLLTSTSPASFAARQRRVVNAALHDTANAAAAVTGAAGRISGSGLKPVHRRATGNARRLARR